ncbi:MAG TPA: LLM class flavin-dependent oxidoreductase [Dehalococcoidia bacterium]|jgi:alkanesulfonate monooxygenase SsuD/methylene tetrahydromethanopterin reductase-like flavin-dependent oxidoreductase (luciferase family)
MTSQSKLRIGLTAGIAGGPGRDQSVEKIRLADQLGYDSLWFGETWGYDIVTSMGEVVRATERIKVGSGIMNVYSRSPGVIASAFATLDELSGGRMLIGLGSSGANVIEHFHGVPFEQPMRRLREYVEIINMLLHGDRLVYHGQIFNLERGFRLQVNLVRDHIPVYIAAITPGSIVQTGEIADGLIPIHWPKDKYGSVRQRLDRGAKKAGRSGADIVVAPYLTTGYVLDEAQREAVHRQAKQPVSFYIGRMGTFYKEMLAREGYPTETAAIEAAWGGGQDAAIDAVPDYMADNIAVVGTPKEIHQQLMQLQSVGVDMPVLSMPPGDPDQAGRILDTVMNG